MNGFELLLAGVCRSVAEKSRWLSQNACRCFVRCCSITLPLFEIVVDNEIAAKDFTALIPELQNYLRVQLKNSKVVMTVRVSEPTETVRAVGRVEKFR